MSWLKRGFIFIGLSLILLWAVSWLTLKFSGHKYAELSPAQAAVAAQYLQGKLTDPPQGWTWEVFYPEPEINLRTGYIKHPDSKGLVIVVPGFTGTIEMIMREVAQLHAAGFSVAAIEYRGQGASWRPLPNPEKGYVEDYGVLASDLAKFANLKLENDEPLFFYSISKGAHITIRMALAEDINVSAYAFIVPMVKINTGEFSYSLTQRVARLFSAIGLGAMYAPGQTAWPQPGYQFGEATGCNSNPDLAQSQGALFAERKELRTSGTTMRWLKETMASSDFILSTPLKERISSPVKVFTAGIDELVDTSAAQQFCNSLSDCQIIHKPESRHCITREDMDVYDAMIQESIDHFKNALPQVNNADSESVAKLTSP